MRNTIWQSPTSLQWRNNHGQPLDFAPARPTSLQISTGPRQQVQAPEVMPAPTPHPKQQRGRQQKELYQPPKNEKIHPADQEGSWRKKPVTTVELSPSSAVFDPSPSSASVTATATDPTHQPTTVLQKDRQHDQRRKNDPLSKYGEGTTILCAVCHLSKGL